MDSTCLHRAHSNLDPHSTQTRVAIYTRKSTEEDLDQSFNSLQAQRISVESYVESQRSRGWTALPEAYDDGGFTGANTDRPAFQRLLRDIEAHKVDCVGVYKIDRLSRSLHDFTRLMALFARHGVTFVSVTQNFDTTTSVGRLTLNQLATFAQFERETIAERISDKIKASRRRGLWTGGKPPLGYDVVDRALVINETEAVQVRALFALYLELGSLHHVLAEVQRRGWKTKTWVGGNGRVHEGRPFRRSLLRSHLAQSIYFGKIPYKKQLFDGVHKPLVDQATWDAVQAKLRVRWSELGSRSGSEFVLFDGIARCGSCGRKYGVGTWQEGGRRRAYYRCRTAHAEGRNACPHSTVRAEQFEAFVLERLRAMARDPRLAREAVTKSHEASKARLPQVEADIARVEWQRHSFDQKYQRLVRETHGGRPKTAALRRRLADLNYRRHETARWLAQARCEALFTRTGPADADVLAVALGELDRTWNGLDFVTKKRCLALLLQEIRVTLPTRQIEITFRAGGVKLLAAEAKGPTS